MGLQRYARLEVAVDALTAALARDPTRRCVRWRRGRSPAPAAARRRPPPSRAPSVARSPRTRATAVWSAGSVREASTVEALTGALGDADAAVREVAAWAIGSCGPERAPAALLRGLGDPDRNVRLPLRGRCTPSTTRAASAPSTPPSRRKPIPRCRRGCCGPSAHGRGLRWRCCSGW
ncbi:MAG: HEAT repeat domain-containing protein [Gemmatimonadetes bacterium]|nr:HEAT repeat domain-containing protein [Gemmatimonadota bacterium]